MNCAEFLQILGKRIRAIRKAKSLSQERLAELAGLHPVYIVKVERGKVKASICTYLFLAKALGITLSELVELPEDETLSERTLELFGLFQTANRLDDDKFKVFTETVKGTLAGIQKS
jgi:transcriptional regulator with XRE-family HTH domain